MEETILPIIVEQDLNLENTLWLKEVWEITTYQLAIPTSTSESIFAEIQDKYSEPHRAYHNLSHLYSMLMSSEHFFDMIENHHLFDLSIWFHDLIYDPLSKENEKLSAQRAIELLSPHLPADKLTTLQYMIESTAKHLPTIESVDNKLFLDLDLVILAAEENVYNNYTEAIRHEYNVYPNMVYQNGRREILEGFLKKEKIYITPFFYDNFEKRARKNINNELESMNNGIPPVF